MKVPGRRLQVTGYRMQESDYRMQDLKFYLKYELLHAVHK